MNKRCFYIFFFGLFFSLSMHGLSVETSQHIVFDIETIDQDKKILIRKLRAKVNALEKRRARLKALDKWTAAKESKYLVKIATFTTNLASLGESTTKILDVEELVRNLQKQLKYLNNARVNKNAKDSWSEKDDALFESKAGILIDSIIKLRMRKTKV